MSEHQARIAWKRDAQAFTDARYSRTHTWSFDGGVTLFASASPANVRVPFSDPALVDPEEAFVASLASCHMLVFLHLAALDGLVVDDYEDVASGYLTPMDDGRLVLGKVILRPRVTFGAPLIPGADALSELHERAHHGCFLANAVKSEIVIEAR